MADTAEALTADWFPDEETFADRLFQLRREIGERRGLGRAVKIPEIAAECSIPVSTWYTWENKGVIPEDIGAVAQKIYDGVRANRAWLVWGREATHRELVELGVIEAPEGTQGELFFGPTPSLASA